VNTVPIHEQAAFERERRQRPPAGCILDNLYQCVICRRVFTADELTEERLADAMAEARSQFGADTPVEPRDMAVLCDECWREGMRLEHGE
jgi:hypothetical protein